MTFGYAIVDLIEKLSLKGSGETHLRRISRKVTIDLEKNTSQETECQVEQETDEGDQGGEDPFMDTEDIDSPFIVKKRSCHRPLRS